MARNSGGFRSNGVAEESTGREIMLFREGQPTHDTAEAAWLCKCVPDQGHRLSTLTDFVDSEGPEPSANLVAVAPASEVACPEAVDRELVSGGGLRSTPESIQSERTYISKTLMMSKHHYRP